MALFLQISLSMHTAFTCMAWVGVIVFAASPLIATAEVQPHELNRPLVRLGSSGPEITYVVLGDSTAAGVGGNYDAGIALSTSRELARTARVSMTNLAISGARVSDVRRHQLAAAEALRPDLVLLSAGANDVTHLTCVRSMRSDLTHIVRRLRAANPAVRIVITGSPDMGASPRIPRFLRGIASWRTSQVNRMFRAEAAAHRLAFAPIADRTGPLFRSDRSLFASDRFHPNDAGYATWLPILNEALAASQSRP